MKRSDDVFFFTLIDFLLQALFFGLLLYVLGQAAQQEVAKARETSNQVAKDKEAKLEKVAQASGFSNLTELLDYLTKLAPATEFKGIADFLNSAGGLGKAMEAVTAVQAAGGPDKIKASMDKLRKYEEGTGKPPCLYDVVGDKKVAKTLATVIGDETTIRFEASNPALEEALQLVGRSFDSVKSLQLAEFSRTFAPLVQKKADCRYTLRFIETTRFVDARDAARFAFYLNIGKR